MRQFQVIGEVQSVCHGHVAEALEEVHGKCIARLPCAANKLSQDTAYQSVCSMRGSSQYSRMNLLVFNLNTCRGKDDSCRDHEHQSKCNAEEHCADTRLRRPYDISEDHIYEDHTIVCSQNIPVGRDR